MSNTAQTGEVVYPRQEDCKVCGTPNLLEQQLPKGNQYECYHCNRKINPNGVSLEKKRIWAHRFAVLAFLLLPLAWFADLAWFQDRHLGDESTYGMIPGLKAMWDYDKRGLAIVLAIFSVVGPFLKSFGYLVITSRWFASAPHGHRVHKAVAIFEKVAFGELFFLIVTLVFSQMVGLLDYEVLEGFWFFQAHVMAAIFVVVIFDKAIFKDRDPLLHEVTLHEQQ